MPRGVGPYDEAQLQGRLWGPLGLRPNAWFDASDLSTLTVSNTDQIRQWRDKVSTRTADQNTSNRWPGVIRLGQKGLVGADFFSDGRWMPFSSSVTARSLVALLRWTSTSGDYRVIWGDTTNAPQFHGDTAASGNLIASGLATTNVINADKWINGTAQSASNLLQRYQNYTIHVITAGSNFTFNAFAQERSFTDRTFIGVMCEMLCFASPLSVADRVGVEGYLAWKWNVLGMVARLPASHPFRNRPPLIGD